MQAQVLDVRILWSSADFQVVSTCWDRTRHASEDVRLTPMAAVEWMRRGSFRKSVRGVSFFADTNVAVLFNPGEEFHVSHPAGNRNEGTIIRISEPTLSELMPQARSRLGPSPRPFQRTHLGTSSKGHRRQAELAAYLFRSTSPDSLWVEQSIVELLNEVILDSMESSKVFPRREDPIAGVRAAAIQEYISSAFEGRMTLRQIAAAVGGSPWHLSRQFTRLVGVSIHRYLTQVRLRHALARVIDGDTDLTRIALDVGFNSHSHFSAAFRKEFAQSPRSVRSALKGSPWP